MGKSQVWWLWALVAVAGAGSVCVERNTSLSCCSEVSCSTATLCRPAEVKEAVERLEEEAPVNFTVCVSSPAAARVTCTRCRLAEAEEGEAGAAIEGSCEAAGPPVAVAAGTPTRFTLCAPTEVGNWGLACAWNGSAGTELYRLDVKPKWVPVIIFASLLGFSLLASAAILALERLFPEIPKPEPASQASDPN